MCKWTVCCCYSWSDRNCSAVGGNYLTVLWSHFDATKPPAWWQMIEQSVKGVWGIFHNAQCLMQALAAIEVLDEGVAYDLMLLLSAGLWCHNRQRWPFGDLGDVNEPGEMVQDLHSKDLNVLHYLLETCWTCSLSQWSETYCLCLIFKSHIRPLHF